MGKTGVEQRVLREVRNVLDEIEDKKGAPFNPLNPIGTAVVNVIASVVFSSTFEHGDPDLEVMLDNFNRLASGGRPLVILSMFTFIFKLPGVRTKLAERRKKASKTRTIMKRRIADVQDKYDGQNVDDFVDAYIREMQKHVDEPDTTFTGQFGVISKSYNFVTNVN